jgi:hypothetical protein
MSSETKSEMKFELKDLIQQLFVEHRFAKNLLVVGSLILFLVFSIDRWFAEEKSACCNWSYTNTLFCVGLLLVVSSVMLLLMQEFWSWIKIKWYRYKYPIKYLDRKFHLIQFQEGAVFLFDNCTKTSHWIASWQTAEDLDLLQLWTSIQKSYKLEEMNEEITTRGGESLDLSEFAQAKKIHTRGLLGS